MVNLKNNTQKSYISIGGSMESFDASDNVKAILWFDFQLNYFK